MYFYLGLLSCCYLDYPTFVDNSLQFMLIDEAFMKQRIYVSLRIHYLKVIVDELAHILVFYLCLFLPTGIREPIQNIWIHNEPIIIKYY